jgi:arylsulfatase A-like enzyme
LPKDLDAVSLVPILRGGAIARERELYFVRREGGTKYQGKSYEAIIRGDWKLLQNDPSGPLELYHLKDDPQERNNLAGSHPQQVNKLSAALRRHIQRGGAAPWQNPDAASSQTQ